MATYLQGITDVPVPIAPFQPDFGMVQKAMSTLQGRYEQGFASVKSAYNQVLNAPISNFKLQSQRDAYVKSAEQRLKQLASVDLSIPENQAAAEEVFAPFWQDKRMLWDAQNTKMYKAETEKGKEFLNSKDEKVREQYSDVAMRYLQNGMEKLQQADPDSPDFYKIQPRRFVPFGNMKTYLNEQATKSGFKVVWESAEGPYLVSHENGPRSVPSFKTFAEDMLADQFEDQGRLMGIVHKEERIKNMKRLNPALTDDQALVEIAKGIDKEYMAGLNSRSDGLQRELEKVTEDMKPYLREKQLDKVQDKAFTELGMRQLQLEKQLELAKENISNYKSKEQDILANPDGYFGSVMKQRAINAWANARAAGEQITKKIDPVWDKNVDIARYQREMEIKMQELGIKVNEFGLKKLALQEKAAKDGVSLDGLEGDIFGEGWEGITGGGSGSGSSGGGSIGNSLDPEKAGRYDGLGSTDVTKLGNAYQLFQERQVERWGVAHEELFSNATVGRVMSEMGIGKEDAVKYRRAMRNYSFDLSERNLSQEDKTLLHDLTKKLGRDVPTHEGFFTLRTKLLDKMRTSLENKLKEGGTGLTKDDFQMLSGYITSTWAIKEHDALEAERQRLVQEQITKDPKKYGKILVNKDGKMDVVGVDEAAKDFKTIKLKSVETGKERTIKPREFAELYLNGRIFYNSGEHMTVDDESYEFLEFEGKSDNSFTRLFGGGVQNEVTKFFFNREYWDRSTESYVQENPNALTEKYGYPSEQKKWRDQLNTDVVPKLPEFQSERGKLGFITRYDLGAKGKRDVGTRLVQEAGMEANHMGIYVNGELSKNDEVNAAIMKVMRLGDDDLKDYVSTALLKNIGKNGRPALEVVMKPVTSSDKTKINEQDLQNLAKLEKIEFELNPEATGEMLQKLRYNAGRYVFGALLQDRSLESDPMLKAAGFSFKVIPDGNKAIVEMSAKEFVNGAYTAPKEFQQEYSFDRITPDELMNNLYGFFFQQLRKNMSAQEAYKKQVGQTPGQFRTPEEVMKAVRGRA